MHVRAQATSTLVQPWSAPIRSAASSKYFQVTSQEERYANTAVSLVISHPINRTGTTHPGRTGLMG